jgi:hypothetical protein
MIGWSLMYQPMIMIGWSLMYQPMIMIGWSLPMIGGMPRMMPSNNSGLGRLHAYQILHGCNAANALACAVNDAFGVFKMSV